VIWGGRETGWVGFGVRGIECEDLGFVMGALVFFCVGWDGLWVGRRWGGLSK